MTQHKTPETDSASTPDLHDILCKNSNPNPSEAPELEQKPEPENQSKSKVFKFNGGEMTFLGEKFTFQGQLNFGFPYSFSTNFDRSIIHSLVSALKDWVYLYWPELKRENPELQSRFEREVKGWILVSLTLCNKTWIEEADGEKSQGFQKCLAVCKLSTTAYLSDDGMEYLQGHPGYAEFDKTYGEIVYRSLVHGDAICDSDSTWTCGAETFLEEINSSPIILNNPEWKRFTPVIRLWWAMGQGLRINFGVTRDAILPLAKELRQQILLDTWLGNNGRLHFSGNLSLRNTLRIHCLGLIVGIYYLYLLEGVFITPVDENGTGSAGNFGLNIWDNFAFSLLEKRGAEAAGLINDIFSLQREAEEREMKGESVDNFIVLYKEENGVSWTKALEKATQKHDQKLKEFQNIYEYLEENAEKQSECDGDTLRKMLGVIGRVVGAEVALHFLNPRYIRFTAEYE